MKRLENNNPGLKVIWIGFQDRREKLASFASKFGLDDAAYDETNELSMKLGITYGAGLVIIDKNGIVKLRLAKGFSHKTLAEKSARIMGR